MGVAELDILLGPWSAGRGPLHVKLTHALRKAMERRVLAPGARLPSERELARQLVVSRSTVVAAYDALRAEGWLESRQGSGTHVAPLRHARGVGAAEPLNPVFRSLLEDDPDDVLSLACAINPAHPLLADAVVAAAAGAPSGVLASDGYQPLGVPELRAKLAELHTGVELPTAPEQILVTTGAQQAINLCAAAFVRPGDRVVVESPGFPGTLDAFGAAATRFVSVDVDEGGVDADGVRDAVERDAPALTFLMPSFHNPTGTLLERRRRAELAELALVSGVPLVEDNALEHIPLAVDPPPAVAAHGPPDAPILTIGSFSKLAWGGLRVGWIRGPAPLIRRLGDVKARTDLGTPMFDQAVAAWLLDRVDRMREDRRAELRSSLELVTGLLRRDLPEWQWREPDGGPALWIRLSGGANSTQYAQVALRHGVEVIPGDVMSPTGDHADYFRLPYTLPHDMLETVMRRLAGAWGAYASGSTAALAAPAVVV